MNEKVVVILGPTASGKSDLAVKLAKKFNGEIISADSRQVYKGLDIGSGKVPRDKKPPRNHKLEAKSYFHKGIPHHLLDVANPKEIFTVKQFKKLAQDKIKEIQKRGKLPIICGGSGFYIQAVVDNISLPEVEPNIQLRKNLEKKSTKELGKILKKLDARRFKTIDAKNPRRLIRAIEIAKALGKVPKLKKNKTAKILQIGIEIFDTGLKTKIKGRLLLRIKKGMVKEVKNLHATGLSWKRLENLGLEYRYVALYLQGKISKKEMIEKLKSEIWKYAKRQRTWFKKDKRIKWFNPKEAKKIEQTIRDFLSKKGPL